jgi:hypothetical protein
MALNILDTTYSGTYAPDMIMLEMFGMDTVEKGLVYPKGDIKKQHTIDRLDIDKVLTPRQANPTDSGTNGFTIDGRVLVPKDVQVYKQFNPRDLEANQVAELLSTTILAREVPATLESYMMQALLNRSAESLEKCLWQGSTNYQGLYTEADEKFQLQFFDGFMKLFVNDPLVNLSTVSPAVITVSNIPTILNDLLTQATVKRKAMMSKKSRFKNLKFICSPKTGDIYGQFLTTATTFKGNPLDAAFISPWRGFTVETVAGMPDDTIIFCHADQTSASNLWVGMNSTQDWELKMQRVENKSEEFFMLGKWKYCVQYGWGQEIFMFTTLTAASFTS